MFKNPSSVMEHSQAASRVALKENAKKRKNMQIDVVAVVEIASSH